MLAALLGSEIIRGEYSWEQAHTSTGLASSAGIVEIMITRAFTWAFFSVILLHQVIPAMAFGIWAGRKKLLDQPEQHRSILMWTAAVGIALSTIGGIPLSLMSSLVWDSPSH
ncbi:hypothetical protein [Paenibacillus sp. BC26]|uniref:hypothetical protein n=1 Tax=Paenibacillus sp. BC26 TaxID=1881032 RepID=UPI002109288F|nr:hypothetical protein [Paenibacillus sp. BC26]